MSNKHSTPFNYEFFEVFEIIRINVSLNLFIFLTAYNVFWNINFFGTGGYQ
jgi:hypothetical protein